MTCAEVRLSLGAHVLGALAPAEDARVAEHLARCPSCSAEAELLAEVPPILARATIDDVEPDVRPSADLFDRLAASATAAPGRPRLRILLAAAAAVAVLAGGGAVVATRPAHHAPPRPLVATAGSVRMAVTTQAQARGTAFTVVVSGLRYGETCHLVAVARDGSRHDAGTWQATYAGRARVTAATDLPRAQLAELVLLGADGQRLVALPMRG